MRDDVLTGSTVAILGGTGELGRGLARRLAPTGLPLVLGSRDAPRARAVAEDLAAATAGDVRGASNQAAARLGDVVLVAVPWPAHASLLAGLREELAGRVVVDCVNPLAVRAGAVRSLPVEEGSAAQQAAALLPRSRVAAAFHHVAAASLLDPAGRLDADVLVLADDEDAAAAAMALADRIEGLRGVAAGGLVHAGPVEALTALLIEVNRRHGVRAGLRLAGL